MESFLRKQSNTDKWYATVILATCRADIFRHEQIYGFIDVIVPSGCQYINHVGKSSPCLIRKDIRIIGCLHS
jgi:hypothetical protein